MLTQAAQTHPAGRVFETPAQAEGRMFWTQQRVFGARDNLIQY